MTGGFQDTLCLPAVDARARLSKKAEPRAEGRKWGAVWRTSGSLPSYLQIQRWCCPYVAIIASLSTGPQNGIRRKETRVFQSNVQKLIG